MQRIRFGGNLGVCSIRDAQQPLCTAASRSDTGKCCVTESSARADAAVAKSPFEGCCIDGRTAQNGGASVSGADGVHEASETLSSSFTLRHHAWMQAIPVSQESCVDVGAAAAELPLGGCCICARCARNGGASDSAAHGAHEASETLSSSLALRNIDQAQANAVSQRAALVLMPRSLIDSVSNAHRWAAGAENPARLFRGQLGCLQRMGH